MPMTREFRPCSPEEADILRVRFRDNGEVRLYSYDPDTRSITRLTDRSPLLNQNPRHAPRERGHADPIASLRRFLELGPDGRLRR